MASSGLMRLRTFSRRSGSIATRSRTSLLRVLHFAYLLQPLPSARSAEMIQTVISVAVTTRIKKQKVSATTNTCWEPVAAVRIRGRHGLRKQTNQQTIGNQRQACGGDRIA